MGFHGVEVLFFMFGSAEFPVVAIRIVRIIANDALDTFGVFC